MATIPTYGLARESIPRAWRNRALIALIVLVVLGGGVALTSVLLHRDAPATPTVVQAPPVATTDAPTVGQLTAALARSIVAPNSVNLQLTYAPPVFFEVTG